MSARQIARPAVGQMWRLQFGEILGRRKNGELVSAPEPFGSGHRWIVIFRIGPKWIEAINPHTMETGKLHVDDWPKYRPRLELADPRRALRSLERRRRQWKRCGAWTGKHETKKMRQIFKTIRDATS